MNRIQKMEFLRWLLEHGADPNHNKSSEPLYRAIYEGSREAVNILLQYGADPNLTCSLSNGMSIKDFIKDTHPGAYREIWGRAPSAISTGDQRHTGP